MAHSPPEDLMLDPTGPPTGIDAWAERIYFGRTLEDKLLRPGRLVGGASVQLGPERSEPGRPHGFELPAPGARSRASFPRMSELDAPEARGVVLHFFANHELLAIELMAECLLRFPDAPDRFRREVVATLVDEQRHLRLYIERMEALGVRWGSRPVNRWFFDALADATDPLDYVARIGMTLEQANLDHALNYGRVFGAVGDEESQALMDRVFRDEVRHVKHGLRWLERWRDPECSVWEAWTGRLGSKLKVFDARGQSFSREARESVGLDRGYIDALAATDRARGRKPTVWWCNPEGETEIAENRRAPASTGPAADLQPVLGPLLTWVADPGDVLLGREVPDPAFLAGLTTLGLPALRHERVTPAQLATRGSRARHPLEDEDLAGVRAFCPSPSAAHVLAPFASAAGVDEPLWRSAWARVGSKADAASAWPDLHAGLLTGGAREQDLVDRDLGPTVVRTSACIVERLRARPQVQEWVLRRDRGQSGRGRRVLAGGAPDQEDEAWITRSLARGDLLVLEPRHHRLADFSLHFDVREDGSVSQRGLLRFVTDQGGRFRAALMQAPGVGLDPAGRALVDRLLAGRHALLPRGLAEHLSGLQESTGWSGPIGIDLMVVASPTGPRVQPMLERNARLTLGRIALAMDRRIARGSPAAWALLQGTEARAARDLLVTPPDVARNTQGALTAALVPTNPTSGDGALGVLAVGREALARLRTIPGLPDLAPASPTAETQ